MTTAREKFQALLRELFQFDCSDLDFGIYRIMNYKRDVIEKFISTDLPKAIADELDRGALADQLHAAAELTETANQIAETLGKDALDADGNLADAYHGTPLGKKYLALQGKAAGGSGREALEATIFNHLYAFFSRYYQDGDFISKRRYSKRQKYAIPYNGEEVYLHWANHDQYYVKTAEYFHDYMYKDKYGTTVHFKLAAANVEQNNVKGDKRFFLLRVKEVEWKEKERELVIPFEFRPLTDQEKVTYGTKNQQDKIIAEAVEAIPKRLKKADDALAAISAERRKNSDGDPVTYLEHHLRQYTRANMSDFFIHKDLKGFLSRELDFYLKNEVLNLDEMEAAGEDRSDGWFQVLRVIKAVGSRIIDFLDQIESFQKMLWEKRKFVTETQYCITVGTIDASFYATIAACDAQWAEWKELFHIDEEQSDLFSNGKSKKDRRVAFLKAHPTLVLDTKHFDCTLVDKLLASFDELDSQTDGLLVHSENFQALTLLKERYRGHVQTIYLDPPYNTGDDGFLYKDSYPHSSWAAMLYDRLVVGRDFLDDDGWLFVSIDEREYEKLVFILRSIFGVDPAATITVKMSHLSGMKMSNIDRKPPKLKEYLIMIPRDSSLSRIEPDYEECGWFDVFDRYTSFLVRDEKNPDDHTLWQRARLKDVAVSHGIDADDRESLAGFALENAELVFRTAVNDSPEVSDTPKDRQFRKITTATGLTKYVYQAEEVLFASSYLRNIGGKAVPTRVVGDIWTDIAINNLHNEGGVQFPNGKKPMKLIERVLRMGHTWDGYAFDFFAGSGTTPHACISLGKASAKRVPYIAVEQGAYFDTKLKLRVLRSVFSDSWRLDKPTSRSGASHILKYIRLESYEDTLSNIAFDDKVGQATLQFDDYLLKYMLKWETRKSETLLNVEQLAKPFSYKLTVAKGDDTIEKVVDLPETFNYLLGLHVSTRKVYDDDGRRYLVYHGRIDHRRIAVIWRETEGWQKKDLERDKKFVAEQKLAEGADEVFVNGDSFIPNAKALEPVFKARMFSTVEA